MGPLAIVCGGGAFPRAVADAVRRRGIPYVLFAVRGLTDPAAVDGHPHEWVHLGNFGRLERLRLQHGCNDIVSVGTVYRPRLRDIRLDWLTLKLLVRHYSVLQGGDNRVLSGFAGLFEQYGWRVHGVHEVAPEIQVPAGVLGRHRPDAPAERDIALARAVIAALGPHDVGQAAVAVKGYVVAVEAAEGTAAMLERVAELRRSGRVRAAGGVLVKAPKPGQDRRLDLPAIGTETVAQAAAAGLNGIAVEAGGTITIDPNELIRAADEAGLFLFGFEPDTGASR